MPDITDDGATPVPITPEVEETPQAPSKRHPWSKAKVQHRPTRKDQKLFQEVMKKAEQ